jgi:2-(1,2-epoxy-1,2-dihydrophenyl)acetyl-CoA isomerase
MEIGYNPLVRDFAQFPKPTIVAVNGICAGGGVGLALGGDIVIAARSASFVQVFGPKLGLVPDMGVTWFAPRLAGRARARGMALLGDRITADQAAAWGLIWEAVDDLDLASSARSYAARLAAGPQQGFRRIKETLDASWENTLDEQLELERKTQGELGDTSDFIEGVTAFLQKRDPKFA